MSSLLTYDFMFACIHVCFTADVVCIWITSFQCIDSVAKLKDSICKANQCIFQTLEHKG